MAKNVINNDSATTIDISTPGEEWLVLRDVLIRTEGNSIHGIHETSAASASRIQVNGFVASDGNGAFALYSQGADSAITIGKSGVLTSTATALRAEGGGADIHNLGRISGTSEGVSMSGEQQTLTNSGVIGSYDAVKVTGGFNTIIMKKAALLTVIIALGPPALASPSCCLRLARRRRSSTGAKYRAAPMRSMARLETSTS